MKVFCIALVVVAALALGEAKSVRLFKPSRFVRSLAPVSARVARSAQSMTDVAILTAGASGKRHAKPTTSEEELEAVLGLAILEELAEEKRNVVPKTQHKKRQSVTSEEAAEAVVGLAVLDELADVAKRSFASTKKRAVNRRESSSEEAAEALLALAVLDELASETKRKAKKSLFKPVATAKSLKRRASKLFRPFM